MIRFSLIIPVFNRPQEVKELLQSILALEIKPNEIIIVEDGSDKPCEAEVHPYIDQLNVRYHFKENTGPGLSRNAGAELASGDFLIFMDSDCLIPNGYFEALHAKVPSRGLEVFGGPDAAHPDFTPIQKAINNAMTGILTTGGIRGASETMEHFHPRSFNMGIKSAIFKKIGGFSDIRFGEDIDLSIRLINAGCKTGLIKSAWVYHKRRTDFRKFFKQVYNSGIARIHLQHRHPGSLKAVHTLPAIFVLDIVLLVVLSLIWHPIFISPLVIYAFMLMVDGSLRSKSLITGFLSVPAGFIQLVGYGLGFIHAFIVRNILGRGEFKAFSRNFYK
jgi:glycosyltransferase involved in cell wall biosynthesis